jgi:hypothetical protein
LAHIARAWSHSYDQFDQFPLYDSIAATAVCTPRRMPPRLYFPTPAAALHFPTPAAALHFPTPAAAAALPGAGRRDVTPQLRPPWSPVPTATQEIPAASPRRSPTPPRSSGRHQVPATPPPQRRRTSPPPRQRRTSPPVCTVRFPSRRQPPNCAFTRVAGLYLELVQTYVPST